MSKRNWLVVDVENNVYMGAYETREEAERTALEAGLGVVVCKAVAKTKAVLKETR